MHLKELMGSAFSPAPYLVYKPSRSGGGQAMKLHLRLDPKWIETPGGAGYFERPSNQGLFLEIAPQEGKTADGHPKFGWSSPGLVRCKLGLADVTRLLAAIREVRVLGKEVPMSYRPGPDKTATPWTMSSFHKYGDSSTAINYTFEDVRSIIRISKSKDLARSIALDLHEELAFDAYLQLALNAMLRIGIR